MTRLAAAHHQSKEDVPGSARCNLAVEVVLPALPWHIDVKRPKQGNKVQGNKFFFIILQSLIDFFLQGEHYSAVRWTSGSTSAACYTTWSVVREEQPGSSDWDVSIMHK